VFPAGRTDLSENFRVDRDCAKNFLQRMRENFLRRAGLQKFFRELKENICKVPAVFIVKVLKKKFSVSSLKLF
jgi:hypothetical protein